MTTAMPISHAPYSAPVRKGLKPWQIMLLVLGGLIVMCLFGSLILAVAGNNGGSPIAGKSSVATSSAAESPIVVASPKVMTVKGTGNSIVQIGEVLNGAFTVQYAFGSWCGQAAFLKADGSAGARFMQDINDCAGSTSDKLAGSAVVNLSSVTMVNVGNTRGNWTITFTPLG